MFWRGIAGWVSNGVGWAHVQDGGKRQVLSANVGDARVILVRGSDGIQLSEDHVPDQCARCTLPCDPRH